MKILLTTFLSTFLLCLHAQEDFNIRPLNDSVYVHETQVSGAQENGVLVVTSGGIILLDIPSSSDNLEKLLQWTEGILNQPIALVLLNEYYPIDTKVQEILNGLGTVVGYHESISEIGNYTLNLMPMKSSFYTIGDCTFELVNTPEAQSSLIWMPQYKTLYVPKLSWDEGQDNAEIAGKISTLKQEYPLYESLIPGKGSWGILSNH